MSKKALFVVGGWEGHTPFESANLFTQMLQQDDYTVEISDTLDVLSNTEMLLDLDLIVPTWTMGKISNEQVNGLIKAVESGVGMAGWHGCMGDSFRESTEYQFLVGGQWVAHPHNIIDYTVNVTNTSHPITAGLSDFEMHSEQYYMHVDPSNHVLANTTFNSDTYTWINGTVMPVVWTRMWGAGRIAYCSLGHVVGDFDVVEAREIVHRSLLWASK